MADTSSAIPGLHPDIFVPFLARLAEKQAHSDILYAFDDYLTNLA
ncbi:MAG: hypothetical protein ACYCW6_22055 [Candidatus Xenobia bacterium]